jgi:His-Xaa-Ser system radical SAM maturase HxsB
MPIEIADKAIDFMFKSPSPSIKVEFQGGESLLNFDLIQHIVERVEDRNRTEGRDIAFVIATNLSPMTDEILEYCLAHDIYISTSLDGPRDLHNRNRPRPGNDSYDRTIEGIKKVRQLLGPDRISALMTTTQDSLSQPTAIIDEYLRHGFSSIFLRSISPYGFAVKTGHARRYESDEWFDFYLRGLNYILDLNRRGVQFREEFAAIILRKILTALPTGYVDLQSPAGMGISCLAFNYDGAIYASDESRMLAEMGDFTFRLGDLRTDSFADVMTSDALLQPLSESLSECVPMCSECAFQPYCGSDPLYHHATQRDTIGNKPTSGFCRKNMSVMGHLIALLEDDPESAKILRSWV